MLIDLLNTAIGLVLGLVTGFYFEHRSSSETRRHNAELEERLKTLKAEAEQHTRQLEDQLAKLRVGVYSVSGSAIEERRADREDGELRGAVLARARQVQDAQGRVSRTLLTAHFFARGNRPGDVDDAITSLCEEKSMRLNGKWLELL